VSGMHNALLDSHPLHLFFFVYPPDTCGASHENMWPPLPMNQGTFFNHLIPLVS
jgi:hypothetical protein